MSYQYWSWSIQIYRKTYSFWLTLYKAVMQTSVNRGKNDNNSGSCEIVGCRRNDVHRLKVKLRNVWKTPPAANNIG